MYKRQKWVQQDSGEDDIKNRIISEEVRQKEEFHINIERKITISRVIQGKTGCSEANLVAHVG
jgi:hypothetical protein